jgi:hypothetical protein
LAILDFCDVNIEKYIRGTIITKIKQYFT